jgi:hypothetical protein
MYGAKTPELVLIANGAFSCSFVGHAVAVVDSHVTMIDLNLILVWLAWLLTCCINTYFKSTADDNAAA